MEQWRIDRLVEENNQLRRVINRIYGTATADCIINHDAAPSMFAVLKHRTDHVDVIAGFGMEFPDGSAVLRWEGNRPITIMGESAEDLLEGVIAHEELRVVYLTEDVGENLSDEALRTFLNSDDQNS